MLFAWIARHPWKAAMWACVAIMVPWLGIFALVGMLPNPFGLVPADQDTDFASTKPFADYIGREYRVVSEVKATAWNDFPDKKKILIVALGPPYGGSARFISWVRPLEHGQKIRIVGASGYQALFDGWIRSYLFQAPGAGLPEGVPIKIRIGRDGLLDSRLYEPITP